MDRIGAVHPPAREIVKATLMAIMHQPLVCKFIHLKQFSRWPALCLRNLLSFLASSQFKKIPDREIVRKVKEYVRSKRMLSNKILPHSSPPSPTVL